MYAILENILSVHNSAAIVRFVRNSVRRNQNPDHNDSL